MQSLCKPVLSFRTALDEHGTVICKRQQPCFGREIAGFCIGWDPTLSDFLALDCGGAKCASRRAGCREVGKACVASARGRSINFVIEDMCWTQGGLMVVLGPF